MCDGGSVPKHSSARDGDLSKYSDVEPGVEGESIFFCLGGATERLQSRRTV